MFAKSTLDIKLIASDIDGTLLDINHNLPKETELGLIEVAKRGVPIMLATGKTLYATRDLLHKAHFLNDTYGAFVNGALLVKKQQTANIKDVIPGYEIIHEQTIAKQDAIWFIEYCLENKITITIYSYDTIVSPNPYSAQHTPHFDILHAYHEPQILSQPDLLDKIKSDVSFPIHKIIIITDECDSTLVHASILQANPPKGVKIFFTVPGLVEIQHIDCSKFVAIQEVCKRLEINVSNVMAFGDGTNDVEMIQGVGWGVAMENAVNVLKAVANDSCLTSDESGVTRYLKEYFKE